jgi:hypothetical protein
MSGGSHIRLNYVEDLGKLRIGQSEFVVVTAN